MPGRRARGRLPWALFTLASGYALLVAGPLWSARGSLSSWLADFARGAAGLPQPLSIALALFAAAALVFVVARQVRDLEQHPYASIAPVLAVFSGLVLSSIRSQLPFPGVGGPQLGLAGLALALMGGALVGRRELGARVLGWLLAALPTLALLLALTALRGDSGPAEMLRAIDAPSRAYLALLAVSSLALGLVGHFARHLAPKPAQVEPMLRLPPNATTPLGLRAPSQTLRPPPLRQTLPMRTPHYESPASFAAAYVPGSYRPSVPTTLALDDPDLIALTRRRPLANLAWLAACTITLSAVAGYFLVVKPEREREAMVARERALKAAQARTAAHAQAPTTELADRMARYLKEREQERPNTTQLAAKPVVTALAPQAQAPGPVTVPKLEAAPKPERVHHHHRHHARREEPKPVLKAEPKAELKVEPLAKPEVSAPAKVEAPKKTQNERDLDLDDLVQKALKGGKQSAADDPILGL